ncbi:YhbD family protein [Paenibacillus glycanilyticus]|uniref:DUF4004 family protein n=1 Tax=Paenibacillus glycanilyticus TaxID=126569 RepID=A0ABQ6GGI7_9BACL|nr:YhbD family protein [Paenibacillus glycanilyticus]GLX69943.1 hypothetical protein MU1_42890 [Paenibacillus glycanilyticus]
MEEELISKKDLLELTGISYGQLYRWKRKNLLPEEWFIRKSAFTGQETFFPKQKILDRIDKIVNMKDDLSLDELADMFSPASKAISISMKELIERNIVSTDAVKTAEAFIGKSERYTFEQTLCVYILDHCLQSGEISLDEGRTMLPTFLEHYKKFKEQQCDMILLRKMGVSVLLLVPTGGEIHFESGVKIILRVDVPVMIEQLKLKLMAI